jgi:hypothetical protein
MKTLITRTFARRRLLAALALIAVTGCAGTSAPVTAEQDKARKTLETAMMAWQKGETIDGMKKASPSILVADPRWERGDKLSKFEVSGEGKPSGAERAFTVTLWVADSKGKDTREQVVYKVGTDPILTVFRSLF